MEIAFILIGAVFLIASVRGTHQDLFALLKNDFTGPNNFTIWLGALFALGAIGYYRPLRPVATAFLTLVIIAMVLANKSAGAGGNGFFAQLQSQLEGTTTPASDSIDKGGALGMSVSSLFGGGASGVIGNATSLINRGKALLGNGQTTKGAIESAAASEGLSAIIMGGNL